METIRVYYTVHGLKRLEYERRVVRLLAKIFFVLFSHYKINTVVMLIETKNRAFCSFV